VSRSRRGSELMSYSTRQPTSKPTDDEAADEAVNQ